MMSGAKKMVPKRRFKEFLNAGDWEQRKLGDFTNQINTFVNPEDAKLPLWSLTAEAGLIEKSDRYERDFLVKKKDQFKRIETNTLVYNPMNITIGSIDIYTGLYPIAVSGYYVSIVYDKNIDTDFLKEVLLLPSSLKMYKNYATGSLIERQRVQYPTFSKLQLLLPNLDEQKAIGQFFKSLNLDITLHQRKLDKLQATKKALLQEMFPEEGQDKPKRRFKGFTDAWEQRKLTYIFNDFIVPMRDKPKVFSGTTPWTRIEDIEGRYINTSLSGRFVSDETIKSMNLKVIPKGSLIVSASATFGVVAIVNNDLITNQTFIGLVPNKDFDIDFLYSLFEAPTTKNKLLKLSAGSTIFYIARESFENLVLSVPSKVEQIKISKIFKSIDNSITLHQRKLDKLKNLKQAYLNEMFV